MEVNMAKRLEKLSDELTLRMESDIKNGTLPSYGFCDDNVIRRIPEKDEATVWRTAFTRDIDKILHCPYYNRYSDKTQVFSFFKNDDITRRALHVQLVSRIARTIGKSLNLNVDLIEAIALGHDIGHTPFGHTGEKYLDEIYRAHTGRRFSHNIHSVRVLDVMAPNNISLQTLSGIATHDGERELSVYTPKPLTSFEEFDDIIESCYVDKANVCRLIPATLEGCVMRVSDIIAYLGKDRQDAMRAGMIDSEDFDAGEIGNNNTEIINNLMVNVIENSYGKNYIMLDDKHFKALSDLKKENYKKIYLSDTVKSKFDPTIKPMMAELYDRLLSDLNSGIKDSPIFVHHIDFVNSHPHSRSIPYEETEPNQIVVDYIASMTDDYFIDLHRYLFPDSPHRIDYHGYFDGYGKNK